MAQRVLLTGANGFIGAHILSQLLARGTHVCAVLRSSEKATQLTRDFPTHASTSQLTIAIVPDITAPGAFSQALQSTPPFDTVIHTASPFLYRVVKDNSEFLDPAIKGTLEVLKAVKAHGVGVKRVVITSSCAAVVDFSADGAASPKKVYTEADWNPTTVEEALAGTQNNAYQASKKYAEKAAWEFLEEEKPHFDLVTLTPPMVYGPLRHSLTNVEQLNQSNSRIYTLFINSSKDAPLPPNGMHVYTDVRDLAAAHILAATIPEASNKRFIICQGQVSSQQVADLLRENIPELEERTPEGVKGGNTLPETAYTCSSAQAEKVLGVTFRTQKETFVELARQLLELEQGKMSVA